MGREADNSGTVLPDEDNGFLARLVDEVGRGQGNLLPLLQGIQRQYHYLPKPILRRLCEITQVTPAQIAGVASFYNQFRMKPAGEHLIKVCHGTACHVAGAPEITAAVRRHLRLGEEEDTDEDRCFTVTKVACLGCCSLAPVMQIDDVTYGHMTPGMVGEAVEDFLARQLAPKSTEASRKRGDEGGDPPVEFRVGIGSCCVASGSAEVRQALEQEVSVRGGSAVILPGGCVGMCHRVPLVEVIGPDGHHAYYGNVEPAQVRSIVGRHLRPRGAAGKMTTFLRDTWGAVVEGGSGQGLADLRIEMDRGAARAFLEKQRRIVLEGAGHMDPVDLLEYRSDGGFEGLRLGLTERTPEELIDLVRASGLRGRGGAGFLTASKWQVARDAAGGEKVVVCNGDEGDPGAFMDRMILESYPYRVIEGMALAAYAVGAARGYLYVRAEYPLAVQHFGRALEAARDAELLGEGVFGTDFSFDIEIRRGAGAFVSGEETALLASIEGRRSMPRYRPPYPAERGLWNLPTVINNVETYANVPWIVRQGAAPFASCGTDTSHGTKVFALAGRIRRGGLIEVPMGITVHEIVEEIGGGIRDGRKFKAVQIGGPSGGCLPARLADTAVDFEALARAGAIMGSGGLVVLDDATCMVDVARYFLQFTQDESCGKCTFCRVGTKRMLEILDRLCTGEGKAGDLEVLEELGHQIKDTSMCGLGRTAPNPILTTLRYFRDEYEAHLQKRCPAGVCQALIRFEITSHCIGCTLCVQHCPADAIEAKPYERHEIDQVKCVRCGTCKRVCPAAAIEVE